MTPAGKGYNVEFSFRCVLLGCFLAAVHPRRTLPALNITWYPSNWPFFICASIFGPIRSNLAGGNWCQPALRLLVECVHRRTECEFGVGLIRRMPCVAPCADPACHPAFQGEGVAWHDLLPGRRGHHPAGLDRRGGAAALSAMPLAAEPPQYGCLHSTKVLCDLPTLPLFAWSEALNAYALASAHGFRRSAPGLVVANASARVGPAGFG